MVNVAFQSRSYFPKALVWFHRPNSPNSCSRVSSRPPQQNQRRGSRCSRCSLAHTEHRAGSEHQPDSGSCQVPLWHPFPSPLSPSSRVLLPAAPVPWCWGWARPSAAAWFPAHHLSHWFCSLCFCQHRALKSAGTAKNPVCTTTPQTSLYFYCSVNYCLNFNKSLRQEGGPAVRFLCKHWARQ